MKQENTNLDVFLSSWFLLILLISHTFPHFPGKIKITQFIRPPTKQKQHYPFFYFHGSNQKTKIERVKKNTHTQQNKTEQGS